MIKKIMSVVCVCICLIVSCFSVDALDAKEDIFEKFIRMWSLYLKSCASAFRVGSIDLFQLLISKGANNELPLTKEYIYQ